MGCLDANLKLKPDTLKGQLVALIRSQFSTEESIQEVVSISADELVQKLWQVESTAQIRQKKKNLSSLKSSVNKSLKDVMQKGKNPEGLMINRDNVFTISDEHKNDLLEKLQLSDIQSPLELISTFRELNLVFDPTK